MVTNKWLQLAIYFEFGIFFNIEFRLSMFGGQNCWGISTLFCDFFFLLLKITVLEPEVDKSLQTLLVPTNLCRCSSRLGGYYGSKLSLLIFVTFPMWSACYMQFRWGHNQIRTVMFYAVFQDKTLFPNSNFYFLFGALKSWDYVSLPFFLSLVSN